MSYPRNFNIDHFKSLNTFKDRIKFCQQNLKYLGGGSSREVFKLDNVSCLKLAKNKKGIAQNEVEMFLSTNGIFNNSAYFAQVFQGHEKYLWIESELAKPCTEAAFKKITGGVVFEDYAGILYDLFAKIKISEIEQMYGLSRDSEIIKYAKGVIKMSEKFDISIGDLTRIVNYGIIDGYLVIIDYGLNEEVYIKFYSKKL